MTTTHHSPQTGDLGDRVGWRALGPGADVYSADGRRLGTVERVLAAPELDLFEGVVIDVRLGPVARRYVDADEIDGIYGGLIVLSVSANGVHRLPSPSRAPTALAHHAGDEAPSRPHRRMTRAWELLSRR